MAQHKTHVFMKHFFVISCHSILHIIVSYSKSFRASLEHLSSSSVNSTCFPGNRCIFSGLKHLRVTNDFLFYWHLTRWCASLCIDRIEGSFLLHDFNPVLSFLFIIKRSKVDSRIPPNTKNLSQAQGSTFCLRASD